MEIHEDTLPVLAILGVILSMTGVNLFIIGDPMRSLSALPLSLVLVLWLIAVLKLRRSESAS
jgi:hypothetical protein